MRAGVVVGAKETDGVLRDGDVEAVHVLACVEIIEMVFISELVSVVPVGPDFYFEDVAI